MQFAETTGDAQAYAIMDQQFNRELENASPSIAGYEQRSFVVKEKKKNNDIR